MPAASQALQTAFSLLADQKPDPQAAACMAEPDPFWENLEDSCLLVSVEPWGFVGSFRTVSLPESRLPPMKEQLHRHPAGQCESSWLRAWAYLFLSAEGLTRELVMTLAHFPGHQQILLGYLFHK